MFNLFSVSEFAKGAGISPQAVRKAIREKRIRANKIGCQWAIEIKELREYLDGSKKNKNA